IVCSGLQTAPGLNVREHWRARSTRVKRERNAVASALVGLPRPALPCTVLLTRMAPSSGLDDDNLPGALKGVRDEVAKWLGVDDRHRHIVRYAYSQRRAAWGVGIEFAEGVT
ncbi:MAG: hypothetical protein ACRC1H_01530, partial [Caldilineaceae bacterium]